MNFSQRLVMVTLMILVSGSAVAQLTGSPRTSQGQLVSAANAVEKATELIDLASGPKDSEPLDQAGLLLQAALQLNPEDYIAHRELCRLQILRAYAQLDAAGIGGGLIQAQKSLERSLAINPKFGDAYVLGGHLYLLMGRIDDAKKSLEKAGMLNADDAWFHYNWGEVHFVEMKYLEAKTSYDKALVRASGHKKSSVAAISGLRR